MEGLDGQMVISVTGVLIFIQTSFPSKQLFPGMWVKKQLKRKKAHPGKDPRRGYREGRKGASSKVNDHP